MLIGLPRVDEVTPSVAAAGGGETRQSSLPLYLVHFDGFYHRNNDAYLCLCVLNGRLIAPPVLLSRSATEVDGRSWLNVACQLSVMTASVCFWF